MKAFRGVVLLALAIVVLGSCAPSANVAANTPTADGAIVGFFHGWLHGAILPFSLLWSLFDPKVGVYEVHNNGGWYNFGFLLGVAVLCGGSGAAARKQPA